MLLSKMAWNKARLCRVSWRAKKKAIPSMRLSVEPRRKPNQSSIVRRITEVEDRVSRFFSPSATFSHASVRPRELFGRRAKSTSSNDSNRARRGSTEGEEVDDRRGRRDKSCWRRGRVFRFFFAIT